MSWIMKLPQYMQGQRVCLNAAVDMPVESLNHIIILGQTKDISCSLSTFTCTGRSTTLKVYGWCDWKTITSHLCLIVLVCQYSSKWIWLFNFSSGLIQFNCSCVNIFVIEMPAHSVCTNLRSHFSLVINSK